MSIHRHILHNGRIREAAEAAFFPGQIGLLAGWGVFSTLRVMDGAVFAWDRHWERMSRDAQLLGVEMPADADAVECDLMKLVEANGRPSCTLRFIVVRNGGGIWEGPGSDAKSDTLALTADLKAWGAGVRLGVQPDARYSVSDFTRAKMLSWAPNLRWMELAQERGFDEVLLLNEKGYVAECTSANVFAAFGDRVFTPPLSDGCLPGVTRDVILNDVRVPGIELAERSLTVDDIQKADEVFITSSTRNLLRVKEIAGEMFAEADSVRERLSQVFDSYLRKDIAGRRKVPAAV